MIENVAIPEASEVFGRAAAPYRLFNDTFFPSTGEPLESSSVTVTVTECAPSVTCTAGLATTVDFVLSAAVFDTGAGVVNVTVAPSAMAIESLTSEAVRRTIPGVVALTVNEAVPSAPVGCFGGRIVAARLPAPSASRIVFPGTGIPAASFKVTVTVATLLPSAGTLAGLT